MFFEYLSGITSLIALFTGGGWFVYYRANKRKANAEANQSEADAFRSMQDAYQQTLTDVQQTLHEVREERDHYKDSRNALRKENEEFRKKYAKLEEQLTVIAIEYKKDIARLSRRLDCISPFLCGVVGCLHRKKVNVAEDFCNDNEEEENDENGNYQEGE